MKHLTAFSPSFITQANHCNDWHVTHWPKKNKTRTTEKCIENIKNRIQQRGNKASKMLKSREKAQSLKNHK